MCKRIDRTTAILLVVNHTKVTKPLELKKEVIPRVKNTILTQGNTQGLLLGISLTLSQVSHLFLDNKFLILEQGSAFRKALVYMKFVPLLRL